MNTNKNTKVKTRIKHIFNSREEVIHNLFYRDEYSIYRNSNKALTASYEYLFRGDHDSVAISDKKELLNDWNGNSFVNEWKAKTCEAVVNRKEKILVTPSESLYSWLIEHSVPNNTWTIYTIDGKIDNPLIATKKYRNQLLKRNAIYLIKRCIETILFRFKLAYTGQYYSGDGYVNANPIYSFNTYSNSYWFKQLSIFLKNNAISTNSTIYKDKLFSEYEIYHYISWSMQKTCILRGVQIPTIKQLIEGDIFDAKHQDIINMKMFYSKYCRGTVLNYKWSQVKTLWNTRIKKYNCAVLDRVSNINIHKDMEIYITDYRNHHNDKEPLWQDVVSIFYRNIENHITKLNYDNRKKSNENKQNAIDNYYKEHPTGKVSLKDWRDGKISLFVTGNAFVDVDIWEDATLKYNGYWRHTAIPINSNERFAFPNTQLRLIKKENIGVPKYNYYIETSRHCKVTLEDAIRLYHMFERVKTMKKDKTSFFTYDFTNQNIRLGYYQLRSIKYAEKVTDTNISLHKNEWVVIIGCHHIWIDDFMNFVHYYHLEDAFGIKNNLSLNIQM